MTHGRRRWPRRLFAAVGVIALVVGLGTAWAAWRLNHNINKTDVSGAIGGERPSMADGALNVLLLGSDTRLGSGNTGFGDGSWEPGAHSDTNLLLHLSADRQSVVVVSIPRDSMVPSPVDCSATQPKAEWQVHQWNHNFTTGGPGCVIRTLEGNTGLYVNHFAVVDFGGFKGMVDALGGVEVCTKVEINDPESKLHLGPGRHLLLGDEALGYVRVRKTLGDGSDLGRIQRQQAFLSSVAQKATSSELLLRPDKLYAFLSAATTSLTTDPDFGIGVMTDLANSVKTLGISKIHFVTVPTEQYPADHNRVQWSPAAETVWSALRQDLPVNAPKKSTPAPSSTAPSADLTVTPDRIRVRVVNSSGAQGAASRAADALRVQGFVVASVATGPASSVPALIEAPASLAEAARTVAAAFPGAQIVESTSATAEVRVILGQGAPDVVDVPNRVGTTPVPSSSRSEASPTVSTRSAAEDICQ